MGFGLARAYYRHTRTSRCPFELGGEPPGGAPLTRSITWEPDETISTSNRAMTKPVARRTARLPLLESPCPSCTAMLDQLDGAAEHASQQINLVAVAKAVVPRVLAFAEERGWRRLRVLSSVGNAYNRDYHGESATGEQCPMLNVFRRDGQAIRHFWGSELLYAPCELGQDPRHVGTIEPLWNLFDLTPEGRSSSWNELIDYP